MPESSKLLDILIQTQNKSGSIKSAPRGMKGLKEALDKVPFDVNSPGMSSLGGGGNMMQGIQMLIQALGGLAGTGGQKTVSKAAKAAGVSGPLTANTAQQIAAHVDTAALEDEMGGFNTLVVQMLPLSTENPG